MGNQSGWGKGASQTLKTQETWKKNAKQKNRNATVRTRKTYGGQRTGRSIETKERVKGAKLLETGWRKRKKKGGGTTTLGFFGD